MAKRTGKRSEEVQSTIGGAIEFAVSEIQSLRDEITDWRDNLDGANMSHMPKYDEVSECADYLDNIDDEDNASSDDEMCWELESDLGPDESMDGDHDSAMTSAGFGTDESYGYFGGDE